MAETGKREIPFNGKLMTADPATVGMNFQKLTNMRYTDTHVRSVNGMTKINSSAMDATYMKTRSAFHFNKSQPFESHVLVQAYNTGLTASHVLQNKTAIPSAGAFEATDLWTDSSGAGLGTFSNAPDGQMFYCNGVDTCMWGGDEDYVGAFIVSTTAVTDSGSATSPIDYTEDVNNTKQDAKNIAKITATHRTWLVGTKRPAKGFKYYIKTANATASTMTGKYHDGSAWQTMALTDSTDTGASLAVTGTVTFSTTVGLAKPKYLEGYYLHWYQFVIDDGTAEIYRVTCDEPFQAVVDMWDGIFRDISTCLLRTTSYIDISTKVLVDDYYASDSTTYCDLSSLAAFSDPDNCIEVGFTEPLTGMKFLLPPDFTNSTASTTMSIDYWDGAAYTTVGTISDGTASGGISFAKSGTVTWNANGYTDETKTSFLGIWTSTGSGEASVPLYVYRIKFDEAIDASCRINYIGGMTASKELGYFKFPVFAQGRIMLCGDMSESKNKATVSSKYMPQVYNGTDSVDVYFGDDGELTCGTELFSQFGSSLYSLVLMFKNTETWVMAGQDINAWADNIFLLSSSIGCADPLTLKTINLHAEPGQGVNRALAIWRGTDGVYMSDGRAPIPVHGDIKEYFDPESSLYIASDGNAAAFVDPARQEYHLILDASTEAVYDIARNRWFLIDRVTHLRCGVTVHDTDGASYCYGFIDTGYMERLEYGTTFDGETIVPVVQFGDMPLAGLDVESRVSDLTLFTLAKTNDITLTHYGDTSSTGTDKTMDHTSTNRLAMPYFDEKLNGYFHSFKYTTTGAFEPIATVAWYHPL